MKRLIFFTVLISAMTLGGFCGVKKIHQMEYPGGFTPNESWYRSLGLDSQQTQTLKNLESSFKKDADQLCMRICRERSAVLDFIEQGPGSREVANFKIEEIGRLQIQLEKEVVAHIFEVTKHLTPAQCKAYVDRIQQDFANSMQQCDYEQVLQ